ncbi:MAG: hypothetical protein ACM3XM_12990 [Mycobacterium leprae]
MIVGPVACAVPGCTEPVIGQCPGFDAGCGRFYCAVHDAEYLCPDCARRRMAAALYKRYMKACAQASPLWERWLFAVAGAPLVLGVGLLAATGVAALDTASGPASLPGMAAFGAAVAAAIFGLAALQATRVRHRVDRLAMSLPGFAEFYKAWRLKLHREVLMTTLVIGAAAVIGAVAAGQERESAPKP